MGVRYLFASTKVSGLAPIDEDERARISRELHDELGQELTALHLALTLTQQRFVKDPQSKLCDFLQPWCIGDVDTKEQVRTQQRAGGFQ